MIGTNAYIKHMKIDTKMRQWCVGILSLFMLIGLGASQDVVPDKTKGSDSESKKNVEANVVQFYVTQSVVSPNDNSDLTEVRSGSIVVDYDLSGVHLSVSMIDGETSNVTINGDLLADDLYRTEKGSLFLLDAQGEVMDTITLLPM